MISNLKNIWKNFTVSKVLKGKDIILLFHHVGNSVVFQSKFHSVSTQLFQSMLIGMKKDWDFVDENEMLTPSSQKGKRPKALLTFDDGYATTLTETNDFLAEQRIPFIHFVNTSSMQGEVLWRDKIRAIIDAGKAEQFVSFSGIKTLEPSKLYHQSKNPKLVNSKRMAALVNNFCIDEAIEIKKEELEFATSNELKIQLSNPFLKIGNHSANHYVLSSLSKEEQQFEIQKAHQQLISLFGVEKVSQVFAAPFGGKESVNQSTIEILKDCGYKALLLTESNAILKDKKGIQVEGSNFPTYRRFLPKKGFQYYS